MNGEQIGKAAREPISMELVNLAQRMANKADDLAIRAAGKLEPIQVVAPSLNNAADKERAVEGCPQWPPLFNELRGSLQSIENSLNAINGSLSRAEI